MADTVRRNGGEQSRLAQTQGRGSVPDLWGWDPFRNFLSSVWQQQGIEIERTESGYHVEMPVPGFRPEQIDVTYQEGVLSVAGKSDRRSFSRSLVLPEDVDADKVKARVEHGMLTLELQRVPEAQPKRIRIEGGQTTQGGGT